MGHSCGTAGRVSQSSTIAEVGRHTDKVDEEGARSFSEHSRVQDQRSHASSSLQIFSKAKATAKPVQPVPVPICAAQPPVVRPPSIVVIDETYLSKRKQRKAGSVATQRLETRPLSRAFLTGRPQGIVLIEIPDRCC